tara:strand:+ start:615 stop:1055 length:441 start_codon:yes stop_codon:yes gene_type:complete
MTMHLVGPYMTTTNYKRKKTKKTLSPNQQEKLRIQWKAHNKDCRKRHIHSAQFAELEDFIAYVNGTYKAPTKAHVATKPYQPPKVRDEKHYPSLSNNIAGLTPRKESMQYTGERKLLGIATMHKSNMVPIFEDNKHEAIEIARMRR